MLLTFSKFFNRYYAPYLLEMKQEDIDEIEDALLDVEERPFPELFGDKDRFIVKNKLGEALEDLDLDPARFDLENGLYVDEAGKKHRFSSIINQKNQEYMETYGVDSDDERLYKINRIIKQALNEKEINPYMVFSRNPLDVLRMSDINNIESCHSQRGLYYKCAKQEAQNLGGIVYLINGQQYNEVKDRLDEPEIFEDPERGIPGIKTQARVRLRKFVDKNTGEDFAVPEERYYEPSGHVAGYSGGMVQDVLQYSKDHQEISKREFEPNYIENNIYHVGGQYEDTPYTNLLNNFFESPVNLPQHKLNIIQSKENLSKIFGNRPEKRIMKEIERLSHSSDIEDEVRDLSLEQITKLLKTISALKDPKYNITYPKVEHALLNVVQHHDEVYSAGKMLDQLLELNINVENNPKLLRSLFGRVLVFADRKLNYPDSETDADKTEKVKQFIQTNENGIKKLLENYEGETWFFYDKYMEALAMMLFQMGYKEIIPDLEKNYINNMISWRKLDLKHLARFEENFGDNIFDVIDQQNLWGEFLRRVNSGGASGVEHQIKQGGFLSPVLKYPKAVDEILNMLSDEDSFYEKDKIGILSNPDFINAIFRNYEHHKQPFENVVTRLVQQDLTDINSYTTRYIAKNLNIWRLLRHNLGKGMPELISFILSKYKEEYNDAFMKNLQQEELYGTLDKHSLEMLISNLGAMKDDHQWYHLENNGGALAYAERLLSKASYDYDDDQI